MKKLLICIILLLAAAAAALPWINGMVMENLVRDGLAQINRMYEESGADIRVELADYHRGYRNTRAQWKVDLGSFEPVYGVKEVWFTERATHGWRGITSETSLEKNAWYADWVKDTLKGKDPLTICTRFSAFDPITSTVSLAAFTLDSEGTPLKIGAAEAVVTTDRSFETVATKVSWQGIEEDDMNHLGPLSFESEMEKVAGVLWQGQASLAVDTVAVGDPGLALSDLGLTTEVAADKDAGNMDISMLARAGDIKVNGDALSGWSLGLKLKKVNIKAYEELYRFYTELIGRISPMLSDPTLSPAKRDRILEGLMVENRMALITQLEKMLKKGFGLEISPVDMTLPQGQIQGKFSLELLKDMTLAGFFPAAAQPELLLDIFSLDSKLSLPGEFIEMQPGLTTPLFQGMKTGLFVLRDGRLHHRAETRDKELHLNGEAVDLSL